jgi:predicted lactoylglutathione lyase
MSDQCISLVTLGVADLDRARQFYLAWGWTPRQDADGVVFFQLNGLVLALWSAAELAEDQGRPGAALGTGAVTLAQNYPSEAAVDERFEAALAAGAAELKRPVATEWGGYSGYIADPDGHVWELAMNPFWSLDDDGGVTIPGHLPEA